MRARPQRLAIVMVAGSAFAALVLTHLLPPLRSADEAFLDVLVARLAPAEPQHDGIALVAFGESSFAALACRSPIDRGVLATLLGHLEAAGVRAIGVDILFDQPTLPPLDERLNRTIVESTVPVVVVTALDAMPLTDPQRAYLDRFIADKPHGHANLAKDPLDGTVRWHVPWGPDGMPSFPARLAMLAGADIPEEPFRIAWRSGPTPDTPPFPIYPAEALPMLPKAWLANRIVLVGMVQTGIDWHRTPLAGIGTPGVVIQAHVLADLLDGRRSPRLPFAGEALLTLALSAGGVALAIAGLPLRLLVPAGLAFVLASWAAAAALFAGGGPLVPMLAPSAAWIGGIAAMTAHLAFKERADRGVLMRLFANHVSQPIAEEIWRERATFLAGGRPRPQQLVATVLFSDIEGFTTVCEALEPEPLLRWLEGYLDAMVRVVAAHDGIVLRFIGDAILAVFGVPVPRTTQAQIDADAERAVHCALQMGRELAILNRQWQAEGLPPVGIRVGIHTGPVVAGSLGGLRHMEYSLLGDTANTAARLESHAKTVDAMSSPRCRIIIGEPTYGAIRTTVATLPVGTVTPKGKSNPVRVWLVLDTPAQEDVASSAGPRAPVDPKDDIQGTPAGGVPRSFDCRP